MAQRCIDTLAGTGRTRGDRARRNLESARVQPRHPEGHRGRGRRPDCRGVERPIDVASMNGERFAVMAGAGFDADMIGGADGALKDRLGRAAYLWTGAKSMRTPLVQRLDQGRRRALVRRPGDLRSRRQRGRALRGRRGVRRRRARRRPDRHRRHHRRGRRASGRGRSRAPSRAARSARRSSASRRAAR